MDIEDRSFWFAHRGAAIVKVAQRLPPDGCVFDVGGGNGYVSRALRSAGFDAIVIEPGPDGARAALGRGLTPVVNATTETAGFRPGGMPAIGLFDVLEHVEDHVGLLVHLRDLLRPGGRIYVTVPAYQWLWSVDDVQAQHFRRYTTKTLRHVMEKAGFAVEFSSYLFRPLPLPILLVRSLPSRLGRRNEEGSRSGEHTAPSGFAGRVFSWALDRELRRLGKGRVRFGSSVLMVASKAP
jgi:SAM-dependent methyltransferase